MSSEIEMEKPKLTLYNTMTQQKEILKPINPGKIGMYVCGITAYDFSHIGHARSAVSFDVLYRYLRHLGYEVNYVRNFTDVDDKIINRANECGVNPFDLSKRFCDEYLVYVCSSVPPSHPPALCQCPCGDQQDMIKLAAKPGEPSWDSDWGPGRQGWHIECSVMSTSFLSSNFDIHGGGTDLKFPHHENEIAQTCAMFKTSGLPYGVNYWLHDGHVTNNNVKMGKSLDNFFTIREITAKYHPLALRHFLMSVQYRSPLNYSVLQLETSSDALYYVYEMLEDLVEAISQYREEICEDGEKAEQTEEAKEIVKEVKSEFETKISDDLNTAHVLAGAFQDAMKFINMSITKLKKMQKKPRMSLVVSLVEVEKAVREVLDVLGFLTTLSYADFLKEMKQKALARAKLGEEEVLQMIETRKVARMNKDFEQSDDIRKTLALKGISLIDIHGKDTVWRPCLPYSSQPKSAAMQATS